MNTPEITVKRREGTGKGVARRLRRAGAVPAILYGGATPQTITVNPRDVLRIIHGHEGTTQLLSLKVEGDGGARMAIIRDMQFDPVTEKLVHVDIQEVRADRAITVRVAVHPVGKAVGVRDTKGILNLVMHEVEVSTLPTNIPERIDADVSNLAIGDVLTVRDLRPPAAGRPKKLWPAAGRALVARGSARGATLCLVKPQSFMNVSGPSVGDVLHALGAGPEDLVLVYDDIDMALGKVRTRLRGSAGGHNGVQSVIDALGTEAIRRVKIGIGRPQQKSQGPDHVLTTFEAEEEATAAAAVAPPAERGLGLLR